MGKHDKPSDPFEMPRDLVDVGDVEIRDFSDVPPEELAEVIPSDPNAINMYVHTFSALRAAFVNITGGELDGEYLRVTLYDYEHNTAVSLHFTPEMHILWRRVIEATILKKEITSGPDQES